MNALLEAIIDVSKRNGLFFSNDPTTGSLSATLTKKNETETKSINHHFSIRDLARNNDATGYLADRLYALEQRLNTIPDKTG